MEIRDVVGYEDLFSIREDGALYSKRSNRFLKLNDLNGYLAHVTRIGGRLGALIVLKSHQLVAQAFIPNPENKSCVNHKDGNKYNNHKDNLEWCTHAENVQHARVTGLQVALKGEESKVNKLTQKEAEEIKELYRSGKSQRKIAAMFGVGKTTIQNIVTGSRW